MQKNDQDADDSSSSDGLTHSSLEAQDKFYAGTGECPSRPPEAERRESFVPKGVPSKVIIARILYLIFNLLCVALAFFGGMLIYTVTHSLSVELDFLVAACDTLSISINILAELLKWLVDSPSVVMMVDLIGCVLSLALLVIVSLYGLKDAAEREAAITRHRLVRSSMVEDVDLMMYYAGYCLLLNLFIAFVFVFCLGSLIPATSREYDKLNLLSSVAHQVVDLAGNLVLFVTSVYLKYNVDGGQIDFEGRARIDVVGSFLVNLCILASVFILANEAYHSLTLIMEMDPENKEAANELRRLSFSSARGSNLGTMARGSNMARSSTMVRSSVARSSTG
eukprot:TRINITY_DN25967_c0_g5_i1.p1 TRINITY_DN25967_c0_g5~~TRINITY_DN25967_c0_g5_i1.p1  ORF type:complete len:337 (+),score=57.36 TRINITY_DN25967_c0_g5_i1:96-1106(+)